MGQRPNRCSNDNQKSNNFQSNSLKISGMPDTLRVINLLT